MHWFLFSFCIAGIAVGLAGAYAQWAILRADWPSPLDYTRATLTDAEREAIEKAIAGMYTPDVHHLTPQAPTPASILRKLLERLS